MPSPAELGKAYFDKRKTLTSGGTTRTVDDQKKPVVPPVVPPVVDPVVPPVVAPPVVDPVVTDPAFNITDPTKDFAYDAAQDEMAQAALREKNRQIANAMNRRGIYGSTIMQEELSSADSELLNTYALMAQDKYNKAVSDRQNRMEIAYANAKKRGYYNNEEAALWGVPPNTRISSGTGRATKKDVIGDDGTKYKPDGTIIYDTRQLANKKELVSSYEDNPRVAIWNVANNSILTQTQKDEIIDSITGAMPYYEEYLRMLSEGHRFPNAQQYYAYLRSNPAGRYTGSYVDGGMEYGENPAGYPTTDPSKYESDKATWKDLEAYWKSRGY